MRSSSNSSITSQRSSAEVLPEINPRKAAATWTDMVYEQIISRRLLSIVERNKRMRDQILAKAEAVDKKVVEGDDLAKANESKEDLELPTKQKKKKKGEDKEKK